MKSPIPTILRRISKSLVDLERSELERDQAYQALMDALKRAEMAAKNLAPTSKWKKVKRK